MDWKKNRLWVALALLVVLVGLAVWAGRDDEDTVAATPSGATLPDLTASEIDELTVTRPGEDGQTVRLVKADGVWRMAEPVDAEVEASTVQAALDKLGDLEATRVAASNAENHARLEVTDDTGIHVVARQAGETLASLFIGTQSAGETMVRVEGEDVVVAARGAMRFAFDKEPKDWRNRKITDVPTERVKELELVYGDTTRRFVRGADDSWAQAPGEPPIERFGAAKVQSLVSSLAQMRATDFAAPDTGLEAAGLAAPASRVVLRYAPEPSEADGEEGGEGEAPPAEAAPLEQVVILLGAPVEGESGPRYAAVEGRDVIYQVTEYYAGRMRPTLEDLQEPEPTEEAPAAEAAPAPDVNLPGGQIPPEVLQQIQQQMARQQMGGN